jgi:hypothetical protein
MTMRGPAGIEVPVSLDLRLKDAEKFVGRAL